MIEITFEVGACSECSKKEVCSIKERRQEIIKNLTTIRGVNNLDDPFRVSMTCRHFNNNNRVGVIR